MEGVFVGRGVWRGMGAAGMSGAVREVDIMGGVLVEESAPLIEMCGVGVLELAARRVVSGRRP